LSLVTDAYSRKVVGYHINDSMRVDSVKQAFITALKLRKTKNNLVYHSNRGVQYCSNEYLLVKPKDLEEAKKMIEESVMIYTHHFKIQNLTPKNYH